MLRHPKLSVRATALFLGLLASLSLASVLAASSSNSSGFTHGGCNWEAAAGAVTQHDEGEWAALRAWDECRFIAEAETGFHS